MRRIAAPAVNATGGLFIRGRHDDAAYQDAWLSACQAAGIATREITVREALEREPGLDPGILSAFTVSDAVCNAFTLCSLLAGARRQTALRSLRIMR